MKVKVESEKVSLNQYSIVKKKKKKPQHLENYDHGIWSHHFMANRWRNFGSNDRLYFWGTPKSLHMMAAAMKLKDAYSLAGKL